MKKTLREADAESPASASRISFMSVHLSTTRPCQVRKDARVRCRSYIIISTALWFPSVQTLHVWIRYTGH